MAVNTRWVQYSPTSSGTFSIDSSSGNGRGVRGYSIGTASIGDTFTIGASTNTLYLSIDGASSNITLYSGASLDPRFIAKDVTEKMRAVGSNSGWTYAECRWESAYSTAGTSYGNKFKIYSGTMGSSSSVVVASGVNTAHTILGFGSKVENGGSGNNSYGGNYGSFNGNITVSGTYYGLFNETYKIVISNDNVSNRGIGTPTKGGSNTYDGTLTTAGVFNSANDITYTVSINTTNGTTVGAGTGYVPTISWTSTSNLDDSSTAVELLYANHYYNIGTKGLMVKFSDAVFNTVDPAWTIVCTAPDYASGTNATAPVGSAQYVWASSRGDKSSSPTTTISGGWTAVGSRGLYVMFNQVDGADYLEAGNEFRIVCNGPTPSNYNITSLNYGNVTVSTESAVKCVMFEVESGAIEVSTVKFGLQSHGSFQHHAAGNNDTYFRYGTVGSKNNGISGSFTGVEWYPGIVAADIDSNTPPNYLYATKANLLEVSSADDSESVGCLGLVADPVFVNIRVGSSETRANSTISDRVYFDYS